MHEASDTPAHCAVVSHYIAGAILPPALWLPANSQILPDSNILLAASRGSFPHARSPTDCPALYNGSGSLLWPSILLTPQPQTPAHCRCARFPVDPAPSSATPEIQSHQWP